MSDEITTRLLQMVSDMSEVVHKTAQDVAVMKAQQDLLKDTQEKTIADLKETQRKQGIDISKLKEDRDKALGIWAVIGFSPAVIAAICAILMYAKR